MNIYRTEFFSNCPVNGLRVQYRLRIEIETMIPVEQILATVEAIDDGFHEDIADGLLDRFGGTQTLVADHHGVTIETIRRVVE